METNSTANSQIVRRIYIILFVRLFLGLIFFCITFYFFWKNRVSVTNSEVAPFYIFSLLLLVFTFLGATTLKYFHNKALSINAACQIAFDVIAVSVFVCLSGGGLSPFATFYIPVILLASLLFGTRGALKTAAAVITMYLCLLLLQYNGYLCCKGLIVRNLKLHLQKSDIFYNFIVHSVTFLVSALVAGFFVDKWHTAETLLFSHIKKLRFLRYIHERILESVPSGVILTDNEGKILYANDSAINILESKLHTLINQNILTLLPDLKEAFLHYSNNSQEFPLILRNEVIYRIPGKNINKVIGCSLCGLREANELSGYIVVFQDITHIKKAEKQQRMLEDFKLVAKAAAEIAHNIKNPLGAISGAAQMLDKVITDTQSYEIKQLSKIIVRESDRLNDAVRTLLQMAKSAFTPPVPEKINLTEKAKEFVQSFLNKPNVKGKFNVEILDDGTEHFVLMDPSDLEIILWNLIDNACEVMDEGGTITVKIAEAGESNYVELTICDEGPGIPDDYKEHIFDPFFTSRPGGTGLGLNITLQLVSRSGGKISYETSPEGTCFKILLPRA